MEEEGKIAKLTIIGKRNCIWCNSHRKLLESDKERKKAQEILEQLAEEFSLLYDQLRKEDADVEDIQNALSNKRHCWDLIETCKKCDKDIDRVSRGLNELKNP